MSATSLPILMRSLGLTSMAREQEVALARAETEDWGYLRLLRHLLETEANERLRRRIERLLKASHLPAGKTIDALYTSSVSNQLAIYDRRMDMVNSATTAGGMLTYLKVGQPPPITAPPLSWLMFYYGAGPYPTNLLHDYIAGLNPTDPTATFDIRNMAAFSAQSRDIYFSPTITGRYYSLDYRTNLLTGTWDTIRTNVPGSPGTMFFSDVRTDNTGFYRIRVDLP